MYPSARNDPRHCDGMEHKAYHRENDESAVSSGQSDASARRKGHEARRDVWVRGRRDMKRIERERERKRKALRGRRWVPTQRITNAVRLHRRRKLYLNTRTPRNDVRSENEKKELFLKEQKKKQFQRIIYNCKRTGFWFCCSSAIIKTDIVINAGKR